MHSVKSDVIVIVTLANSYQSAAGWEHKEQIEKHSSQKDYSVGFGGKFGVQDDRKDASALGWDHKEDNQTHDSQKGMFNCYRDT